MATYKYAVTYMTPFGKQLVYVKANSPQNAKSIVMNKYMGNSFGAKQQNPGKILTPGKWIKARAIRVHRGKLEILK